MDYKQQLEELLIKTAQNRPRQIDLAIETGQELGMISLDRSLVDLVRKKEISLDKAQFFSTWPEEFKNLT